MDIGWFVPRFYIGLVDFIFQVKGHIKELDLAQVCCACCTQVVVFEDFDNFLPQLLSQPRCGTAHA